MEAKKHQDKSQRASSVCNETFSDMQNLLINVFFPISDPVFLLGLS